MSPLLQQQTLFVSLLAKLFAWANTNGYLLTLGEAWRPPETAALYAQQGRGIAHSLHTERLAIDLNLFDAQGNLLSSADDYRPLAEFWCSLHPDCRAGVNFTKPDADHFSLTFGGVE